MADKKEKLFLKLIYQGISSKNYDALKTFIETLNKNDIEAYTELTMSKRFRFGENIYYFILLRLFKNIVDSKSSYELLLIEENIINGKYAYNDTTIWYGNLESEFYLIAARQLDSISPLEDFRFLLHKKYKTDTGLAYVLFSGSHIKDSLQKTFLQHVLDCKNYFSYNRLEDFRAAFSDLMLFIATSKNKVLQYEDKNEILFQLFIALKEDEFKKINFFLLNQLRLLVLAFIFGNSRKTFKEIGFSKEELTILFSSFEDFKDGYYGDYLCEFLIPQMSKKIRHTDIIEEYLTLYMFAGHTGVRFLGFLASKNIRDIRNSKSADEIKQIKVPDGTKNLPIGYVFWGTEESAAVIYYYEKGIVYLEFRNLTSFSLFSVDIYSGNFSRFVVNSQFYVQLSLRTKHLLILMPAAAKVLLYLAMALFLGPGVAVEAITTDYASAKLEEAGITHTEFLQIAFMLAQLLRGRFKAQSAADLEGIPLQKAGGLTKAGVEAESEVTARAIKTSEVTGESRMARATERKLDQTAEKKLEQKVKERGTSNPATGANGTQARTPQLQAPTPATALPASPPTVSFTTVQSINRSTGEVTINIGAKQQIFTKTQLINFYLQYSKASATRQLTRLEEELMMYGYIYKYTTITDPSTINQIIAGGTGWKMVRIPKGRILYAIGETGKTNIYWGAFEEVDLDWYVMGNQVDFFNWWVKRKTSPVKLTLYEIEITTPTKLPMSKFAPQPNIPQPPVNDKGKIVYKFQYYFGPSWAAGQGKLARVTELAPFAIVDLQGNVTLLRMLNGTPTIP